MRTISLILTLTILAASSVSCQKKTCKDFKVGLFESPDKTVSDIKIIRNDSVQIETSEKRDIKDTYNIYWKSDCEYFLVLKETSNPQKNLLTYKDTLRVSISAIEENTYQYTALLKGQQFVGDLKQIKETVE
ncbi:MAG: hypothetical protein KDC83_04490 [Flavobacteriales bacterium]|nr:hypothetical protein [Flavobacteriales bacterium]